MFLEQSLLVRLVANREVTTPTRESREEDATLDGYVSRGIASALDDAGIPTPRGNGKWSASQVK